MKQLLTIALLICAQLVKGQDVKALGLFDSLEFLKCGTKPGPALDLVKAFRATGRVVNELKSIVPGLQNHIRGGIEDVATSLHNVINAIANDVKSDCKEEVRKGRGLFDTLESLTSGTQLGTALKVINAVGMTQRFLSELKQLVPDIQKHLNGSIDDITTALHNIVNSITDEVLSGGNVGDRKGRGLFDTLESLTSGTQLGTALKVINAVGMTQRFLSELKQLVPDIQKHLNGSIDDITTALHNIVNSITDEVLSGGNVGDRKGRGLFDTLESLTSGTQLGTALKVINAVGMTQRFLSELKQLVPDIQKHLNGSIDDITTALHNIVNSITDEVLSGGNVGDRKGRGLFDSLESLTSGTQLGTALKVINAVGMTQRFLSELKQLVPDIQKHLNGSIDDITTALHNIVNSITDEVLSGGNVGDRKGRGLFDTLESLTSGTQLGTALKVINAVGMTQRFLSELKQLVPDIQKHLNGSIDDITTALHNIVNSITDEVLSGGNVGDRKGRGLFDSLESLTSGTQLGTALKVINAVGMTQRFLSELKQLVPDIQKHLNGSIDDITTALHNIVNSITDEVLSGGNVGDRKGRGLFDTLESLTSGTQLGTALKVINAVGMTQRFLSELKQLVPDIQKHLNGSIDDITTALHNIVNSITDEVLSVGNVGDRKGRGLFDTLESLTSGTQLGTALKVINAVGMTQRFLSELKQLVPDIQKHLNGSIDDITTALHNIVNSITDEVLSGGNVGDRKGRDIFDMETALNLIKDVENTKRFVNEINDIVPGLGERLKKTLEEISSAMHAKVSLVTEEIMAALQ